MKKVNNDKKVKELTGNNVVEQTPKPEQQILKLPLEEANLFTQVLGIILIGDDRLKAVQTHFIEMIKRNNEINSERPTK